MLALTGRSSYTIFYSNLLQIKMQTRYDFLTTLVVQASFTSGVEGSSPTS
jgi:hypothetical protein